MCWYQTSRLSSPQSLTCLTAKQAHHQNFICSAKTFLTSSFQWYILVQAPSGHLKAKCGSWECSMGQRKGVGSVPRRVGKAWLRQQGPKQAGLCFSFLWGSTKQKVEPWAIPATSQNQDIASTSKSPCQHLPQHLTHGAHPALTKTGICSVGAHSPLSSSLLVLQHICYWGRGDQGSTEHPGWGSWREGRSRALGGAGQQQELATADNVPV